MLPGSGTVWGVVTTAVQVPFEHSLAPPQALPQPPQLSGSYLVSTQAPPQFESGEAQLTEQVPPEQTCPAAHWVPALAPWQLPDAPQCALLVAGSMQVPPQSTRPCWQLSAQLPPEQAWPTGQVVPQLPQLVLSVCVLAQNAPASLLHSVELPPQVVAQAPFEQTCPAAHALPQLHVRLVLHITDQSGRVDWTSQRTLLVAPDC